MEYSSELRDPQVILPHADWRGTYDRGTTLGSCIVYSSNGKQIAPAPDSTPSSGDQYGGVVGGGTYSGTREHCIDVDWPASYTYAARQYRRGYNGPDSWMGSLIFESRDASGLYYRRNRYYDSDKGRFTQEDPIGLAGGVNAYGFGNGDPVTFIDPFGLQICRLCGWEGDPKNVEREVEAVTAIPAREKVRMALIAAVLVTGVGAIAEAEAGGVALLARIGIGGGGAARAARAASDARVFVPEGESVLAVVKDGTILRYTTDITLSHAEFVRRAVGVLPEGAEAVTIGKYNGVISAMTSSYFNAGQPGIASEAAQVAARSAFR